METLQHWVTTGGWLMIPLVLCSVVALTVIVERSLFWLWWRIRVRPGLLGQFIRADDAGRRALVGRHSDPVLRAVAACWLGEQNSAGRGRVEMDRQRRRFGRLMPLLETVVSIAPLLGILGTVVGIIISFDLAGQTTRLEPAEAIGGIAQAFITTAYGLIITIPSLAAFNYFRAQEERAMQQLREAFWAFDGTLVNPQP